MQRKKLNWEGPALTVGLLLAWVISGSIIIGIVAIVWLIVAITVLLMHATGRI